MKKGCKYQVGGKPKVFTQADTYATSAHEDSQMSNKFTEAGQALPGQHLDPYHLVNTGFYNYHPAFQAFNMLAQMTTGFANMMDNVHQSRRENQDYIEALQQPASENYNEAGQSDVPQYYQAGGSIVDWMNSHGMDASYGARKKMFDKYFANNYSGTADQNIAMLQALSQGHYPAQQGGQTPSAPSRQQAMVKGTSTTVPSAPSPAAGMFAQAIKDKRKRDIAKSEAGEPKIQSGVMVDKGTNEAWIIKNGKKVKQFPVLTGQSPNGEDATASFSQTDNDPSKRATPSGYYMMQPRPNAEPEYENNIFGLRPIAANGFPAPKAPAAGNLAIHQTYDPAYRNQFYYQPGDTRYKSYGCINCRKPDMQNIMQTFPQGDTLQVVNSKRYQAGGMGQAPMLEAGEVYQDGQGMMNKVSDAAPTHDDPQGGVEVPDAKRILEDTSDKRKDKASKALRLDPNQVKGLTGYKPDTDMTHAKAMEFAGRKLEVDKNRFLGKIRKNVQNLEKQPNDKYASNSLDFNMLNMEEKPQQDQIFENLFTHQEQIKRALGIPDSGKYQTGGYVTPWVGPQVYSPLHNPPANGQPLYEDWVKSGMPGFGGISTYPGGQTPAGRTTPTGKSNAFGFQGGLDEYKKVWQPFVDLSKHKTVSDAQGATYDWMLQNAPDALRAMWQGYGNTAQGLKSGILTNKYKDGNFQNADLGADDLKALRGAYVDNMLGIRTLTPGMIQQPPADSPAPPEAPQQASPYPQYNTPNLSAQPKSRFFEPLHWYDVASPISGMLEGRAGNRYNPVELNKIRLHQQNPLPTLQAGQRDYNASLQSLPQNGQGYANLANLYAQKYSMNDQVLGRYEDINKSILDRQDMYNAQVADRQSGADQQAREVFEQKVLGSKEALRQQHKTSFDELTNTLAQNRKLNREGNLLMQMFPAFDQNAQYNGYRFQFRNPMSMPMSQQPNTDITKSTNNVAPQGKKFITLSNGKKIYFN